MLENLRRSNVQKIPLDLNQPTIQTPPVVLNNNAIFYKNEFSQRQKEYETMLEKKSPDAPDFSEKIEDGVISNMDELIKTHLQQRENELKMYGPPPISNPVKPASDVILPKDDENNVFQLKTMVLDLSKRVSEIESKIEKMMVDQNKN
jgi:hypothetical protein